MPPDERRDAIIDVVLPLLLEHGSDVSTRQIAEAAGIAEGTIFRVFPDKAALLDGHRGGDPRSRRRAGRAARRRSPALTDLRAKIGASPPTTCSTARSG